MNRYLKMLARTALVITAVAIAIPVSAIPPTPPTFTVNDHAHDLPDDNPGNGTCHTTAGTCTLRAAIMEANRSGSGAIIVVPAATYTLTILANSCASDGEACGDLNLTTPISGSPSITITGAGAATTTIDANKIDRVMLVSSGRSVEISGVTLRNGYSQADNGGAIYNDNGTVHLSHCVLDSNEANGDGGGLYTLGTATASDCIFSNNKSTADLGGGISNAGTFDLDHSTVTGNTADFGGGGIYNDGTLHVTTSTINGNNNAVLGGGIYNDIGTVYVSASTISGNTATADGGAIYNGNVLFVANSTISANGAYGNGGGIFNLFSGVANVYNITVAYNEADSDLDFGGDGAGIYNDAGGVFNQRNSVVAGNYLSGQPDYEDCYGEIGIFGSNRFYATPLQCGPALNSLGSALYLDSLNELDILSNQGGPTQTIALISPSSLIGNAVGCFDNMGALLTDQRGRPRPPSASNLCDIGAFEYNEIFADGF